MQSNTAKEFSPVVAKPILKWAGGKTQMLSELLPKVPSSYGRYIEPFFGGGALFFALQPEKAIVADSNPELINMYRQIAEHVPKDEMPAYLEWILWRAALAIDHMVNEPYEVRGFKLDSDFLPVSAAGGGKGDLYCEFEDFTILTEVTMSTSSRQEAMEGEPVRRHVSDAVLKYDKPVYGMFIAVRIDTNTAETFRHGIWYTKDDTKQRLDIVPLTLAQFQKYFVAMFEANKAVPEKLRDLIMKCELRRDALEAPEWKPIYRGDYQFPCKLYKIGVNLCAANTPMNGW